MPRLALSAIRLPDATEVTAVLIIVVILPFVLPAFTLASQILIFALAVLGSNLLLGYGGMLSFGQGMFFGAGSYIAAIVMLHAGVGLLVALATAVLGNAVIAALVGMVLVRRAGLYFVMLTLAFAEVLFFLAVTMSGWTGGENGLLNVPRPPISVGPWKLVDVSAGSTFYVFIAVLFVLAFLATKGIVNSPFGSTLVAIRENEPRASALGYHTGNFKLLAFVLAGAAAGLAGALYAMLFNFAPLHNINLSVSQTIVVMTIIGGADSAIGALIGAIIVVLLGAFLSPLWPRWELLLGLALIAVSLYLYGGVWGGIRLLSQRIYEVMNASRRKRRHV